MDSPMGNGRDRASDGFRLGEWWVDPALGRLYRDDEQRQLEPKAMDLLMALVGQGGKPLAQREIIDIVWGHEFVAPGTLKHLVWQLRRDLGDDARRPRYIETIPRRGYRLVAEVHSPIEDSVSADAEVLPPATRSYSLRSPATWWGLAIAASLVIAASLSQPGREQVAPLAALPLTSFPGNEIDPALDSSGRRVAFAWDRDGNFDIFTQTIGGEGLRAITSGPANERSPAWSPGGGALAFVRSDAGNGGGGVFVRPRDGGPERKLAGTDIGDAVDLAWSPDGEWLVVAARSRSTVSLIRVPYHGGAPQVLTTPSDESRGDFDPVFSPDGSMVAFRRSSFRGVDDLMVVSLEGGAPRCVLRDAKFVLGIAWSTDGSDLIFTSDRLPRRSLWRVPIGGGEAEDLGLPGGFVADPAIAPDGTLVYQAMQCDSNLWRQSLVDDTEQGPLLVSTHAELLPRFSPDGRQIAFLSDRSGHRDLWVAAADGTSPRRLTNLRGASIFAFSWSPDASRIAFDARIAQDSDVFVVHASGGRPRRVVATSADEIAPSWTADGQSLYYSSNEAGKWQIWRRTLDGGGDPQMVIGGVVAREDSRGAASVCSPAR